MTMAYVLTVGIVCLLMGIMWNHKDLLNLFLKVLFECIAIWSIIIFIQMIL